MPSACDATVQQAAVVYSYGSLTLLAHPSSWSDSNHINLGCVTLSGFHSVSSWYASRSRVSFVPCCPVHKSLLSLTVTRSPVYPEYPARPSLM